MSEREYMGLQIGVKFNGNVFGAWQYIKWEGDVVFDEGISVEALRRHVVWFYETFRDGDGLPGGILQQVCMRNIK